MSVSSVHCNGFGVVDTTVLTPADVDELDVVVVGLAVLTAGLMLVGLVVTGSAVVVDFPGSAVVIGLVTAKTFV